MVAHVELEDTAVVVFREGGPDKSRIIDLDPAYLVRHNGKWLALFKLTKFNRPYIEHDEAAILKLTKLQSWFDEQKPKLQALLGGGT